jgi:hypothetical protein
LVLGLVLVLVLVLLCMVVIKTYEITAAAAIGVPRTTWIEGWTGEGEKKMREQEETAERNTGFKVDTVDTYMNTPTTTTTYHYYYYYVQIQWVRGGIVDSITITIPTTVLGSPFFSGHLTRSPSSAPAPFPLLFTLCYGESIYGVREYMLFVIDIELLSNL